MIPYRKEPGPSSPDLNNGTFKEAESLNTVLVNETVVIIDQINEEREKAAAWPELSKQITKGAGQASKSLITQAI